MCNPDEVGIRVTGGRADESAVEPAKAPAAVECGEPPKARTQKAANTASQTGRARSKRQRVIPA